MVCLICIGKFVKVQILSSTNIQKGNISKGWGRQRSAYEGLEQNIDRENDD